MRLEVARHIAAPPEVVWRVLTDWERQPDWMVDAQAVEVLTPTSRGVGVTIRCPTNLLGVTVQDVMRVTAWEPPRRLEVVHLGDIITGSGAFVLTPDHRGTRLTWSEQVVPALGRVGEWGASTLVRPVLVRVFGHSLDNLAALAQAESSAPPGRRPGAPARWPAAPSGVDPAVEPHGDG